MSKISEGSIKDRIRNLAKEKSTTASELLKRLYLERFLARLSRSSVADKFIFKGGNLLAYLLEIGRQTKDLDFLMTQIKSEESSVQTAFESMMKVQYDDGFELKLVRIEGLNQPHMNYPGFRVVLNIRLIDGKLNDNLQIDIGIGDKVTPESHHIDFLTYTNNPFFKSNVSLLVYPPEAIYAEKLETILAKGSINSRMKDFHDLILLGRAPHLLDRLKLQENITQTFQHRGTPLSLPIQFDESQYATMNKYWTAHGSIMGSWWNENKMPNVFKAAVSEINLFLSKMEFATSFQTDDKS